jgi:type IV pilus assembly protein PilB
MVSLERQPLGTLLVGRGIIASAQLDRALDTQRAGGRQKLLGEILIEQKLCSDEQVAEVLAAAQGIPFARVSPRLADAKVVGLFPIDLLRRKGVLPLFRVEGTLTVALAEPTNLFLIEEIERRVGHRVQVVAATARDIRTTLDAYLPSERAFIVDCAADADIASAVRLIDPLPAGHSASDKAPEPAIVRLLESCIQRAVAQRATEIHIEPGATSFRVRFRIDGRLVEHLAPPRRLHEALVSLIKRTTAMDPRLRATEPQEGRARVAIGERRYALDAFSVPLAAGEKVVLRIAPEEDAGPLKLEKLGFSYEMLKQWRRLLAMPAGLILVAGPTGSGKRAVMHSALHERNAPDVNLCSIEERIERVLPGVNQVQVNEPAGFGFAAALRAVLRQEPDVLMIEQLPDADTARLAAQAALGGKLVLAGIHASDAPTAVWRLAGLGLDPQLLASILTCVLGRRLVRKLCPSCREPREATAAERRQFDRPAPGSLTLFTPRGCERCNNLGYVGRIGIHELLVPDELLRDRLSHGIALPDLKDLTRQQGIKSLRLDGLEKVRTGITTLDEVFRAGV